MTDLILEKLEADGLDVQDCRGQAYGNAAVMVGKRNGVQAHIKEVNPDAQFVVCTNHSLNRVGVHAAAEVNDSITFFGTMDRLFAFFSASTGPWRKLVSVTKRRVKRAFETRWSARYDAGDMLRNHLPQTLTVLGELTDPKENIETRTRCL